MRLAFAPYKLQFKEPAGTSRGILHSKSTYFLKIWDERDPSVFGIGEAAVFPVSAEKPVRDMSTNWSKHWQT